MPQNQSKSMWLVLSAVAILVFLLNIDYTSVNLALVAISEEVPADLNSFQWLLSGYVLAWAALVVPAGRLADLYGKRTTLLGGIVIFLLGSGITGIGQSIEILIIGRILQGIGAAIFSPAAYGLIFTAMPQNKQGFGMGVIAGVSGFGLAAGPSMAGYIIKYLSWRWIFYINIPLGILVILFILGFVAKDKPQETSAKLDALSIALLSLGLGSFMFAVNQIEIWGLTEPRLWGFGLLGLISLGIFWFWDGNRKTQTLPRALLHNSGLMSTVYAITFNVFNFSLILVMMSLYLQNTLRYTSYETGLIFLPMTLAIGILSPIGGKFADRMDIRIPIISGFIMIGISTCMMSFLHEKSSLLYVCIALFFAGFGLGQSWPNLNTAMFRAVKPTEINTASGIFTMATMLANSLSVILATSLMVIFGRQKLSFLMNQKGLEVNTEQYQTLTSIIAQVEHSPKQLQNFTTEQIPDFLEIIDKAFLHGLSIDMWVGTIFTLCGIIPVYWGLKHLKTRHLKEEHIVVPL